MTHYEDMDFVSSLRCHYCQRKIAMHYKAKLKRAGGMVANLVRKSEWQFGIMQEIATISMAEINRLDGVIATLKQELERIQSMDLDEFALYQHNIKYRSEK